MFSKILIKLIDQAIVPAILLLSIRIISVVLISRYLGIETTLYEGGFGFTNPEDYILVNSYSILSMVIVLFVGLMYVLVKALVFHDTHIRPGTTAKIFSYKMSSLIQTSYDLYTQGSIWISYTYLLTIVAGIMAGFGLMYTSVFYIAFVMAILATVLFIVDIEHELHVVKRKTPDYDIDWSDHLEEEGDVTNA
jgi:hypothetical protein